MGFKNLHDGSDYMKDQNDLGLFPTFQAGQQQNRLNGNSA